MDYDLGRLGDTEFEHLVQALAIAELGISVTTFGAGRDGGREATFKGRVADPNDPASAQWDGYGIVQAKSMRFDSPPSEAATAIAGLVKKELDEFIADGGAAPRRRPRPQYYIVATNVRLSPVAESGGLDRVEDALANHSVGLFGYAIWHYEHICRLLAKHPGIARTFAGFVTPGDVLSQLVEMLSGTNPDLGPTLRSHAASQIAARESLKIETGEITDTGRVRLSDVAVDLPAMDDSFRETMVLRTILARGDESLRPSHSADRASSFVIIGGPGQGKSTLGQIVAQCYRVALLADAPMPITPRIDTAIANTRARLRDLGLPTPRNRRWPVVVEIAALADAIAENPNLTVVEFAARQLRNQSADISAGQLAGWLAAWPWALVFDGLDEVPAASNRAAVISALEALIVEAKMNDWDLLVVGTTRPLGYENEFDELRPERLELRQLSTSEGLSYGRQIIATKFAHDPEKVAQLSGRLEASSRQPHVSKLMVSPLQISILEFLVEELVELPQTRYGLFDGYYRAIYARESAKAAYLGAALRAHSEQVDWVHERVAIGLQVRSERTGEAVSSIPDDVVGALFAEKLLAQGYETESSALAAKLEKATRQRLVLLVPHGERRVTFEVRSLQEYMAARWLTSGPIDTVFERLDALASSAYWRNTWLLAAGRVYATRMHDRDALLERLRRLDTETALGSFLGYGAQIAIDLLEDDFASAVPAHRRSLIDLALTQMSRWPGPELKRLSGLLRSIVNGSDGVSSGMALDRIEEAYGSTRRSRLGAVAILRDWQKDGGVSGHFARKKLVDGDWRPHNNAQRASKRAKVAVGNVLDPYAAPITNSRELRDEWKSLRVTLNAMHVVDDVTPAEAITVSRSDFDVRAVPTGTITPRQEELAIRVANAAPIKHAPSAIAVRRLLAYIDQSKVRGDSDLDL
ncbi:NACHT domain-containing protein [Microbacterium thalli]|uniref:NACHT domain-containing protein n=1 Tax=Microbacterium thalli TaxID=3027921 RepID=A0ABT5SGB3_9MICO|nr:hypothetical protein [Microbacterium thalli]MDD7961854.1 hypothetical protein [Microbacterium thalli]